MAMRNAKPSINHTKCTVDDVFVTMANPMGAIEDVQKEWRRFVLLEAKTHKARAKIIVFQSERR